MDTDGRAEHWHKIYTEKDPTTVSWYQIQPTISLDLIAACGLGVEDPIIDIGGGASVLVDHLLQHGFRKIAVLDIADAALAHARKRLGQDAQHVQWIATDITTYRPETRFALWHDRAVFHFLTDPDDRQAYVRALTQGLRPGGHLILAAFAIGGPDRCSGLPVEQYDARKLLDTLGSGFALLEERREQHLTPAQRTQAFAYFHLIKNG